ncbi:uncharacterized protein LACBIDRAFT_297307 [Laccaria bicolor S238N-H82]|uniref:Predicted protein n=1 Tax=Laccaria bicolor (strain S238N-H82 / ATCC MYA-4686) TaxID=486041 RepID=B0DAH2_LACBS|nr:uncharacterized protein LACBIDRAFT_297307 [Laccaria bicolor S238N-H82]EDR08533.1 predicted protein [Laccaria bicolor S238N-H82]|eukprot:XP_001880758.1 predicted protein [Laccaria bicolor S238N-H82]
MFLSWVNVTVSSYVDLLWYLTSKPVEKKTDDKPQLQLAAKSGLFGKLFKPTSTRKPGDDVPPPVVIPASGGRPRLYALIIGINNYDHQRKLHGAVPDADAIKDYLVNELKVPEGQIVNLRNSEASRTAIIDAFNRLRDHPDIKEDDPILIYYAGHGGTLSAPPGWESGSGAKIQTIVPQDYDPTEGKEVYPIPDRTIGGLIDGIANKKGNNITVVFDCCHSGSGTRDDEAEEHERFTRAADFTIPGKPVDVTISIPKDLDLPIWQKDSATRGARVPVGFVNKGVRSHILLAACSADELAKEEKGHGCFTSAFLALLKNVGAEQLTYVETLDKMEQIAGQNPQCEGAYRDRIFFDAKAPTPGRACYNVTFENSAYIMKAGSAHGIGHGAEFTLYKDQASLLTTPLGVMTVKKITPFKTELEAKKQPGPKISGSVLALQTKAAIAEDLLLHVPLNQELLPVFQALASELQGTGPNSCKISLCEDRKKSRLEIVIEDNKLVFNILDQRVLKYGLSRIPYTIEPDPEDIRPVLRAAAHYYWHLNRTQPNNQIQNNIKVEFYKLQESDTDFDEAGSPERYPVGDNLCRQDVIEFTVDDEAIYGIKIVNNTPWDLYPNVFYFDNSELSITAYYKCNVSTNYRVDVPLQKKGGTLTLGYGSAGETPFEYYIPDNQDLDVGFLKTFLSTEPLDLSKIPQHSPFVDARGMGAANRDPTPTWGSILVPVVQHRTP